ncbi:MAG: DUF1501 domain-containing protein [Polyangiaceae bacterium]
MRLSKRRFLEILGVTGSVVALRSLGSVATARADEDNPQLLLMVQFEGAWDQLLALDPRNNNTYADNTGNKIFPAYDLVTDPAVGAVLGATGGTGIQTRGNLGFGPAVAGSLLDHAADLAIVRGIMMDTLTHEVGRRYFSTGKFPRGLSPNGSSLTTMAVALQDSVMTLPNLAIDFDAYNEGQPAYASAIHARSAEDVHKVLSPLGVPLEASSDAALEQLEGADLGCLQNELDGGGMVGLFRDSRAKARSIVTSGQAALFDLQLGAGSPQQALLTALDISTQADLEGPKGKAALAALALENAVSQAVGVRLVQNLDDHTDWADNQATTQLAGWDALGRLISYLKAAEFKGPGGGSIWSRTTLLVCSDFARGPRLNDRGGRDHHLASSCLVAGPGIAGNSLVGATSDNDMGVRKANLDTGVADDDNGQVIRPADVHATLLASMGLSYDHLSNTSPQIIGKLLKP